MKGTRTPALLLLAALVACGRKDASLDKAGGSAGTAEAWPEIEWFPSNLAVITAYPKWDTSPMADFLGGVPGGAPPCVAEVQRKFLRYYAASPVHGGQQTIIVVTEGLERAAFEECVKTFAGSVFEGVSLEKQGDLAVLSTAEGAAYFGYRQVGNRTYVIGDTDRARVEMFTSAKGSLDDNALLTEQIRAVEHLPAEWGWTASTVDMGSNLFGVPSSAYRLSLAGEKAKEEMTLAAALVFASAEEAGRARQAFADVAAGKGAPELARVATAFKVEVVGNELHARGTVSRPQFFFLAAYAQRKKDEAQP